MTKEEAKEFLESVLPLLSAKMQLAIKTLEQEPILDKIRAEIESEPYVSKMEVLDIIDKYRTESEDKE